MINGCKLQLNMVLSHSTRVSETTLLRTRPRALGLRVTDGDLQQGHDIWTFTPQARGTQQERGQGKSKKLSQVSLCLPATFSIHLFSVILL